MIKKYAIKKYKLSMKEIKGSNTIKANDIIGIFHKGVKKYFQMILGSLFHYIFLISLKLLFGFGN